MSLICYKELFLDEIKKHGLVDSVISGNNYADSEYIRISNITLQHPYDKRCFLEFDFSYDADVMMSGYIDIGPRAYEVFPRLIVDELNILTLVRKLIVWIVDVFSREFYSHGICQLDVGGGVIYDYPTQIESLDGIFNINNYKQDDDSISFNISLSDISYTIEIGISTSYHYCTIFIQDYTIFETPTSLRVNLEGLFKALYSTRQIREAKLKQFTL
jgi:hypothetical protein